jgi:hypothetical protein
VRVVLLSEGSPYCSEANVSVASGIRHYWRRKFTETLRSNISFSLPKPLSDLVGAPFGFPVPDISRFVRKQ